MLNAEDAEIRRERRESKFRHYLNTHVALRIPTIDYRPIIYAESAAMALQHAFAAQSL
jgi:hypothetical protein